MIIPTGYRDELVRRVSFVFLGTPTTLLTHTHTGWKEGVAFAGVHLKLCSRYVALLAAPERLRTLSDPDVLVGEEHERTRRHDDTNNAVSPSSMCNLFCTVRRWRPEILPGFSFKENDVETLRQFMRPFIPLPPVDRVPPNPCHFAALPLVEKWPVRSFV